MAKQYDYQDNFEMVYLRHEYLSKIKVFKSEWVRNNEAIVNITAKKMYDKLRPNFEIMGFDIDDLVSITNVYMLAYMGLYSLTTNEELKQRFISKFTTRTNKEPEEKDFIRTERNNLINFLRQRLFHCANLCERKSRNIKVGREKHGIFAFTADSKASCEEVILQDYKKLGYRKVTQKEYKDAIADARLNDLNNVVDVDGFKIFEIQIFSNGIQKDDYQMLLEDNFNNVYNQSPEHMMVEYEDSVELEGYRNKFNSMEIQDKINTLSDFLVNNKNSNLCKSELKTARKMLEELKNMV